MVDCKTLLKESGDFTKLMVLSFLVTQAPSAPQIAAWWWSWENTEPRGEKEGMGNTHQGEQRATNLSDQHTQREKKIQGVNPNCSHQETKDPQRWRPMVLHKQMGLAWWLSITRSPRLAQSIATTIHQTASFNCSVIPHSITCTHRPSPTLTPTVPCMHTHTPSVNQKGFSVGRALQPQGFAHGM